MLQRENTLLSSRFRVGQGMRNNSRGISLKRARGSLFSQLSGPPSAPFAVAAWSVQV